LIPFFRRTAVAALALVCLSSPALAQTREMIDAPTVSNRVKIRWDEASRQVTFALDESTEFRPITGRPLLRAKPSTVVTYPRLNPLRVEMTATRTVVEVPRAVSVTRLLRTLLTLGQFGAGLSDANVAQAVDRWRQAIDTRFADGADGPAAIGTAADLIERFLRDLPALPDSSALSAFRHTAAELRQALLSQYVNVADRWIGFEYRLAQFEQKTAKNIVDALLGDDSNELIMRAVAVSFSTAPNGALLSVDDLAGSAAMVLKKYSRLTKEYGIGTLFSSITRPDYGTTQNEAGQTVVGRTSQGAMSNNPAFVFNLVCLCDTGPFVAPMFQVGITTSRDVPGFFAGGGVRLFPLGRGDISVGAGGMMGWVKDLRTLEVGSPVGGTTDIEADLGWKRRLGWYGIIQYKF
jgi:hypothetical protein